VLRGVTGRDSQKSSASVAALAVAVCCGVALYLGVTVVATGVLVGSALVVAVGIALSTAA
jgi:hypothetical protein